MRCANLQNDFEAADSPPAVTAILAAVHIALSLSLLYNAVPTLLGRGTAESTEAA